MQCVEKKGSLLIDSFQEAAKAIFCVTGQSKTDGSLTVHLVPEGKLEGQRGTVDESLPKFFKSEMKDRLEKVSVHVFSVQKKKVTPISEESMEEDVAEGAELHSQICIIHFPH